MAENLFDHPTIAALRSDIPGHNPPMRGYSYYDAESSPQNAEAASRVIEQGGSMDDILKAIIEVNGGDLSTSGSDDSRPLASVACSCTWYPSWWLYRNARCAVHGY